MIHEAFLRGVLVCRGVAAVLLLLVALPAIAQDATPTLTLLDACLSGKAPLTCAALNREPAGAVQRQSRSGGDDPSAPAAAAVPEEVSAITGLPIDRHDRLTHYLAIQVGFAGGDLWSTGYCLDKNPRCKEGNPLGKTVEQRVGLKLIQVGVFAGGASVLERGGHRNWARVVNVLGAAIQGYAIVNNIRLANQKDPRPLTPAVIK